MSAPSKPVLREVPKSSVNIGKPGQVVMMFEKDQPWSVELQTFYDHGALLIEMDYSGSEPSAKAFQKEPSTTRTE